MNFAIVSSELAAQRDRNITPRTNGPAAFRHGDARFSLAAREGLEPPTLALGKLCSILLSYRAARPSFSEAGQGGKGLAIVGPQFGSGAAAERGGRKFGGCARPFTGGVA